ncbi:MAG: hypothetical protein AAB372_00290 [Patescibacteria group bacterium]
MLLATPEISEANLSESVRGFNAVVDARMREFRVQNEQQQYLEGIVYALNAFLRFSGPVEIAESFVPNEWYLIHPARAGIFNEEVDERLRDLMTGEERAFCRRHCSRV